MRDRKTQRKDMYLSPTGKNLIDRKSCICRISWCVRIFVIPRKSPSTLSLSRARARLFFAFDARIRKTIRNVAYAVSRGYFARVSAILSQKSDERFSSHVHNTLIFNGSDVNYQAEIQRRETLPRDTRSRGRAVVNTRAATYFPLIF